MKSIDNMEYFKPAEDLVKVLMKKTQNSNPLFFRVLVSYYFAKVASMMRCNIQTHDRGIIPVSLYALNLATSGSGKGFSTNIVEEKVIGKFKERFLELTFPQVAKKNLAKLALKRAAKNNEDADDTLIAVEKEFNDLGTLVFSFDSGTTAAVKQMRHKLLMANAGSVNLEIDEIGSNLLGNIEVLNTFLELYDVGKVKQKLIKHTSDNKRNEEIEGRTPTNMMLFGTPSKLLDGGKVEDEFNAMLETGYARRCLFGYHRKLPSSQKLTPEEVYDMMTNTASADLLEKLSINLSKLADPLNFNTNLTMTKKVSLTLIEYKLICEELADEMRDHEEVQKAEMAHRYYKALKLAGAYAFIDGSDSIKEEHLYNAIKLVEESGTAFKKILNRKRNYAKLAHYIADAGHELTQVDLIEDCPYYRGTESNKREIMNLCIAYGYQNNIIIKRSYIDDVEFLRGESMDVTDLSKMTISYSTEVTKNYKADYAPFDQLHKLVCLPGYNYTAHHFIDNYRSSSNLIPGFNLVILDIDGGINLKTAQELLSEYKCLFATTKRHTKEINRFRIILPLSHIVKLTAEDYPKFMQNLFDWLPFNMDEQTKDSARKWLSHKGEYKYQDGKLLDATLFIPQTRKQEKQTKKIMDHNSLTNLERWFYLNTDKGNRSNQLIKYALILVDNGYNVDAVKNAVMQFNNKLKDSLEEDEINNTIMVTVIKAITKRDINK